MRLVLALVALMAAAGPLRAELLAEGEGRRVIPFQVMDGKPMLPVTVDGRDGVMMFDLGTPEVVFLNRGAATLGPGQEVGRGFAASGQEIVVQVHDAPELTVGGRALALLPRVPSGDFGFAEAAFGADFMGFVGLPAVQSHGVLLDYARSSLTVLRWEPAHGGDLPFTDPKDVVATLDFLLFPEELPMVVGRIGEVAIQITLDSGDSGTVYLTPATRARLQAAGLLAEGAVAGMWELSGLMLGAALMPPTPVALVEAGGEADRRNRGQPDELRLGAAFFQAHPTFWDFPARRLMVLGPDARLVGPPGP